MLRNEQHKPFYIFLLFVEALRKLNLNLKNSVDNTIIGLMPIYNNTVLCLELVSI